MKTWLVILTSFIAAVVANLLSAWIIKRLRATNTIAYTVALSSGEKQQVEIPRDIGESADSVVQDVISATLKAMSKQATDPRSARELERLATELEKQRIYAPLSRRVHVLLGRAYRLLGDVPRAIAVLSEYIESKLRYGQLDRSLAIAYYNRGCYFSISGELSVALDDLKKSLELAPDLRETAVHDTDFSAIRSEIDPLYAAPVSS